MNVGFGIFCIFAFSSCELLGDEPVRQILDLNQEIERGVTTVWTPAFQNCWDELIEMHPLSGEWPETPTSRALNDFEWDARATLPNTGSVTVVGAAGPEFARLVNQVLAQHFSNVDPLDPAEWSLDTMGFAALTLMKREVSFALNFKEKDSDPLTFINGKGEETQVRSFGSFGKWKKNYVDAAHVLAYQPGDRIAVRIGISEEGEAMFLLMDPKVRTLKDAMNVIGDLGSSSSAAGIDEDDTLLIPYLALRDQASFLPLLNQGVDENAPVVQRFVMALQAIDLQLVESGARMETKAFLIPPGFTSSAGPSAPAPKARVAKQLIFNRPFYFFLWKKGGTHPYFAAHIDGSGVEKAE